MGKLILIGSFFAITPIFLLASVLYFAFITYQKNNQTQFFFTQAPKNIAYAALPSTNNQIQSTIVQKDARVEVLRDYLVLHRSPLESHTNTLVETADNYGLDYRLLPAIAMNESTLCKNVPKDSYNCWGFGIYGEKVTKFEGYTEAIEQVAKTLAQDYLGIGLVTPEQIMTRYTPSSDGSWAKDVNFVMDKLRIAL